MVAIALLAHVSTVRDRRQSHAEKAAELKRRKDAFDLENAALSGEVKRLAADVEVAEAELKGAALAHFAIHQDKKPCPGVDIKDFSVLEYDEAAAFQWAKAANTAIIPEQLDKKMFAKIAASADLPFVTKKKQPQAQIATDIDKALAVAVATDASIAEALAIVPVGAQRAEPEAQPEPQPDIRPDVGPEPAQETQPAPSGIDAPLPWDVE